MMNFDNTTLLIQGNIAGNTLEFYKEHKKKFTNIVLSTWEGSDVEHFDCPVILNKMPEMVGPGNINCQIKSSKNGIAICETKFIVKCRTDILIQEPEKWLDFCSGRLAAYSDYLMFVLGLSYSHPFSPRDQIFIGRTDIMKKMFDLSPINEHYRNPTVEDLMYPELYLGLNHCRTYDSVAEKCWDNPQLVKTPEVLEYWQKVKTSYMLPVPTTLKYYWPKHYPNGYNYTRTDFGEFWFEQTC